MKSDGKVNDGGPAFPVESTLHHQFGLDGMALRDYFAAKAMQGIVSCMGRNATLGLPIAIGGDFQPSALAKMAFEFADAMILERERTTDVQTDG